LLSQLLFVPYVRMKAGVSLWGFMYHLMNCQHLALQHQSNRF